MTEKEFYEAQKKAYAPMVELFNSVPIGEKIPSNWQAPEGYTLEKFEVEGIPVERLTPNHKTSDCVIFHAHGGGYVLGYTDPYREIGVAYSQMAGGAEVISFDYRLAPKYTYPAILEDAAQIYKWLLEQGYDNDNIVMVGDSAGGNLVLVTPLYLKDQQMPLPKGVIAISPWCKLAPGAESFERNLYKDCILGAEGIEIGDEVFKTTYVGGGDYKCPYISPVYGDFKGFPNLLIQGGSHEMLVDDMITVINKAKEAGVNVRATIYEGMSHDFQLLLTDLKESKAAWAEMGEFIKDLFEGKQ